RDFGFTRQCGGELGVARARQSAVVGELKVGARDWPEFEGSVRQQRSESVAFALIKKRQVAKVPGVLREHVCERPLRRRVRTERDELVHFAQFVGQILRRGYPAHLPPRVVVNLAKRPDGERAILQLGVTQY